jgi:tripartite ATP-independent transporter DctP family solute receptor
MSKTLLRRTAILIGAAIFGSVAGQSAMADNLKLAHQFAPTSLPGLSAVHFADLVKEKTAGATTVTVIPGGALGDEGANLQQLQNGSIDLALTGDLVISSYGKPYLLMTLPFLYRSPEQALHVYNGALGQELAAYLYDHEKLRLVAWQYAGTRVLTSSKPIHSLADLKGLKMRLPANIPWVAAWQKTGVAITPVAFTELQLALQTGTVTAQENPPNFIIASKFYEVQKYLMPTNHYPQMQSYLIADSVYATLPPAERQAIADAMRESADWTSQRAMAAQQADVDWLTTKGGMVLTPIDLTGLAELERGVPTELMGPAGQVLYDRIQAVQ